MLEQLHLLHAFLLHRTEVLLVGSTQICQYTDGRLDDVTERCHLIRLTDTRLKESHLCLFVEQPY